MFLVAVGPGCENQKALRQITIRAGRRVHSSHRPIFETDSERSVNGKVAEGDLLSDRDLSFEELALSQASLESILKC